MNDELVFTEEDLESMADKLIEEAAGSDIAAQQETEILPTRKKSSVSGFCSLRRMYCCIMGERVAIGLMLLFVDSGGMISM